MINLIVLNFIFLNVLKLLFMLTFFKLLTFCCFSRINSLMLKIELRYFEINIFKVFKIVNVYTLKKYNR